LDTRQERVTIVDNLDTAKFNIDDFGHYKNLFEFIHADLNTIDVLDLKRNIKLKERVQLIRSYLIKGGVPKSDIKISSNQHVDKNDISIATRGR
jgi:hypothetical protein